jgi:hypothetical protein
MSGFPIRTPWDHSLVDSSPRPIAASHVLHRLLVPRHPPFALDNLTYRKQDARVHCAILNQQPTHNPTAPHQTLAPSPAPSSGMRGQVMPGQLRKNNRSCSFRTQQGANHLPSAAPTVTVPRHPEAAVLGPSAVADGKLASVSACEHPTTTSGRCGLLDDFRRLVAP